MKPTTWRWSYDPGRNSQVVPSPWQATGDRIVTRRVDRHISDGTDRRRRPDDRGRYQSGFVKNGTAFTVTAALPDGSLSVRSSRSAHETVLPAGYVAQHVELGYAVTAYRCQGMTVDTTHTIATSRMTREAFYVAMTRGCVSNRAYICTDPADNGDRAFGSERSDRDSVLDSILTRTGTEPAAHTVQSQTRHQNVIRPPRTHGSDRERQQR